MTGSGVDQNKRLPMVWSADGKDSPQPFEGATQAAKTDGGSVEEQEANPDSLLNWYKKVLRTKAKYPQIASSTVTAVKTDNDALAVLNYGKDLTIVTNYSWDDAQTLVMPKDAVGTKIGDTLSVSGGTATLTDGQLSIPAQTTVILTK
jgi:alpha-amylase